MSSTEVRVHRHRSVVDRRLERRRGVGRVVEVEREVAGRHVGHRVGRVDGLQAELEGHVGLLLEAQFAAPDERHVRALAALLHQQARGIAGGVADLGAVVRALGEAGILREPGTAVAVPEDVRELGDQLWQRLGDLRSTDDDDVDALLGEVAHRRGCVGGLDVVDDDRLGEAVLLRDLFGGVHHRLVVRTVVGRTGGGDPESDFTVAVAVEVDAAACWCLGTRWCFGVRWGLRVRRSFRAGRCFGLGGRFGAGRRLGSRRRLRRCRPVVVIASARGDDQRRRRSHGDPPARMLLHSLPPCWSD